VGEAEPSGSSLSTYLSLFTSVFVSVSMPLSAETRERDKYGKDAEEIEN
jgi:hypothetical protein